MKCVPFMFVSSPNDVSPFAIEFKVVKFTLRNRINKKRFNHCNP